jgi:SAM-dependent methyltransferase
VDGLIADSIDLLSLYINKQDNASFFRIEYAKFKNKYIWLDKVYLKYKLIKKPLVDYSILKGYIENKNVLDFGCGKGELALFLQKKGFQVILTDIVDYLIPEVKEKCAFYQYHSLKTLNRIKNSFDVILLKTVLHHIKKDQLNKVIKALCSYRKEIIIIEDIFGKKIIESKSNYLDDESLQKYCSLNLNDQLLFLVLMDVFGNLITQGFFNMDYPFGFKTIEQWNKIFMNQRYLLKKKKYLSIDKRKIHCSPQVLLVYRPI